MSAHADLPSIELGFRSSAPQQHVATQTTDYSTYLRRLAGINTPSMACSAVSITLDLIFTLIALVVGTTNMQACPAEPRIPIYLVVLGTVNLVSIGFSIVGSIIHWRRKDKNLTGFYCVICSAITIIFFQVFSFVWLIVGSVWVFSIRSTVQYTTMNEGNYCQGNLYQYTFVSLIFQYILPWLICCCKNIPWKK